jgi:hypothetical protein
MTLTTVFGKRKWNCPCSTSPNWIVGAARLRSRRAVLRRSPARGLEQIGVVRHVHDRREAGMRDRAVVALEEVLGADLPVRFVLRLRAREEAQRAHVDSRVRDPLRDVFQELGERRSLRIRVDEHERPPGLEPERNEAEAFVEATLALRPRRREQPSVETVRPGVVRALERLALARALADDGPAVAADVEEGSQRPLAVVDEQYRDVARAGRVEAARLGDLVRAGDVLPEPPEDPLLLELEHRRVDVPAPRKRSGAGRAHRSNATDGRNQAATRVTSASSFAR